MAENNLTDNRNTRHLRKEKTAKDKREDKQMRIFKSRCLRPRTGIVILAIVSLILFIGAYIRISAKWAGGNDMAAVWLILACASCVAVSMVLMIAFLFIENRELLTNPKNLLMVATLLLMSAVMTAITSLLSYAFTAAFIAIILCALLISKRSAYMMTVVMAAICMLLTFNFSGKGSVDKPFAVAVSVLVGGVVAVLTLNTRGVRISSIISGALGGAASAFVLFSIRTFCGSSIVRALIDSVWMLGGCVLCGVLATGFMPLFENVFDVATDARLNELMNNNNPILKRLMLEAPGTYHHSLIVAVMAEAACELVGANSLLCKTAAYYHDVGKLVSPRYFKENQGEYNIHDDLPPEESARRIIAHPTDGADLLKKNKFPSEIVRMAAQHHGDSTVFYFYSKALNSAPDPSLVNINDYRYKAPKPGTKEDAILMLADCCEAAVRSIKRPTSELIEERVHTIIDNLWRPADGQLSECPLTSRDVRLIESSFIKNLIAQYHERIEYPAKPDDNQPKTDTAAEEEKAAEIAAEIEEYSEDAPSPEPTVPEADKLPEAPDDDYAGNREE